MKRLTNRTKSMLNLGSYNYLGFADDWGATCRDGVLPVLDSLPVACSINRKDYGETAQPERDSSARKRPGSLVFSRVLPRVGRRRHIPMNGNVMSAKPPGQT